MSIGQLPRHEILFPHLKVENNSWLISLGYHDKCHRKNYENQFEDITISFEVKDCRPAMKKIKKQSKICGLILQKLVKVLMQSNACPPSFAGW